MKNDILKPTKAICFPEINLDGVKGVLIDLDNTLYHWFIYDYDGCDWYCRI